MKVGDLVLHNGKQIGIIDHIWEAGYGDLENRGSVDVDVWFEDGEFQVDSINLEVISESR
jgi:hypothetical protein